MTLEDLLKHDSDWRLGYRCKECHDVITRAAMLKLSGVCHNCGRQVNNIFSDATPCVFRYRREHPRWMFWKSKTLEFKDVVDVEQSLFHNMGRDCLTSLVLLTSDSRLLKICSGLRWSEFNKNECSFDVCTYDGKEVYEVTFTRKRIS